MKFFRSILAKKHLVFLCLFLLFTAGLAWFFRPNVATDPIEMLGKGAEEKAMQSWLEGSARPEVLWLVLEGENAETVIADIAFRWQELALPGVVLEEGVSLLEADLAELIAWSWLVVPEEEIVQLEEEQPQQRIEQTLYDLQYGLAGKELLRGAYDPLRLRKNSVISLFEQQQLVRNLPAQTSEEVAVLRIRCDSKERAKQWYLWLHEDPFKHAPELGNYSWGVTGEAAFAAEIEATMRRDIQLSVWISVVSMIGLLWFFYGRAAIWGAIFFPVLSALCVAWLVAGIFFAKLHILGAGCAALLLGLVIDYAVVGKVEAVSRSSRFQAGQGIFWSAISTAIVFAGFVFSQIPGLVQFGVLIAAGVIAGAAVVLGPLWNVWLQDKSEQLLDLSKTKQRAGLWKFCWSKQSKIIALLLVFMGLVFFFRGMPSLQKDMSMTAKDSRANWAMQTLVALPETADAQKYLVAASDLPQALDALTKAQQDGQIDFFAAPHLTLLPQNVAQKQQRLLQLASQKQEWDTLMQEYGFEENARKLDLSVISRWQQQEFSVPVLLADQLVETRRGLYALVTIQGKKQDWDFPFGVAVGWDVLSAGVFEKLTQFAWQVGVVLTILLLGVLAVALRSWKYLGLVIAVFVFSACFIQALHACLGLDWSPFALATVPLLLGIGLDYQLHLCFAARREKRGEQGALLRTTQALAFCWASTVASFASLAFAKSPALTALGTSGALGVFALGLVSLCILPYWLTKVSSSCTNNTNLPQ